MGKTGTGIFFGVIMVIMSITFAFPRSSFAEEVTVAKVNGTAITEAQVNAALSRKISSTSFHRNIPEEKLAKLKEDVLEELIEEELMYQDAVGKKVSVSDEEVNAGYHEIEGRFAGKEALRDAMKKAGTNEKKLKQQIRRDILVRKIREREIDNKADVSEEEARDYYERNRKNFKDPGRLKLREIFFSVPADATAEEREEKRKLAEDVLSRARSGEDFGILAWNHSEDKYRYKSGEIGYVHTDTLLPEARKALAGTKIGEATDVVKTIYGYYIFYLEERREPAQMEFQDVKDKLMKDLRKKKYEDLKKTYINGLRANAKIEK